MARRRNAACGVPCVVKGFVLNMKVEKDHTRRRPTCEGGGERELVDQAFFVFLLPRFYVRVVAQVDLYGGHREETEASRAEGLGVTYLAYPAGRRIDRTVRLRHACAYVPPEHTVYFSQ